MSVRLAGFAVVVGAMILSAIAMELFLPFFDSRYVKYFYREITKENFEKDKVIKSLAATDQELGWDTKEIVLNFDPNQKNWGQAYGDSFVQSGHGGASWQKQFELKTGKRILNFGVGAYGLDQAVLKFEKYGAKYKGKVAILGLYHQTFRRSLSYHSFYYFTNSEQYRYVFKPFFAKTAKGFRLFRPPPCVDVSCIKDVLQNPDNQFAQLRAQYDFWFRQRQNRPRLGFPRILAYASVIPHVWKGRQIRKGKVDYYFPAPHSVELIKYLIRRFARHARQLQMQPLFFLIYGQRDLKLIKNGVRWDKPLLGFLKKEGFFYVDSAAYILQHHTKDDDFSSLVVDDGHLNEYGDGLLANALAEGINGGQLQPKDYH